MKKWLLIVPLFLMGCFNNRVLPSYFYGPNYYGYDNVVAAKKTILNVFWELGVVQVKMKSLLIRKEFSEDSIKVSIERPVFVDGKIRRVFCTAMKGAKIGERIYANESGDDYEAECLYSQKNKGQFGFGEIESAMSFLGRKTEMFNLGDELSLVYCGDSLHVVDGSFVRHKRIDSKSFDEYKKKSTESFHLDQYGNDCSEMLYEIVFSRDSSIFSLVAETYPTDYKGYKPLRLDPSILPLESPGYKKLLEQEASLRIGK